MSLKSLSAFACLFVCFECGAQTKKTATSAGAIPATGYVKNFSDSALL